MSKKNERVQKLVALDNMLRHQSRNKHGGATFTKAQLIAASEVLEQVLKLDNISMLKVES